MHFPQTYGEEEEGSTCSQESHVPGQGLTDHVVMAELVSRDAARVWPKP